jgi:hypothetical protein
MLMSGSLSDPYSFGRRQSFVPYAPVEARDENVAAEAEQVIADAAETRELGKRALDATLERVVNGESGDEMDRASWDLGERADEAELLLRGVHKHLSIPED